MTLHTSASSSARFRAFFARAIRSSRVLSPLLLLVAAACDPCFGTSACVDPYIEAQGRAIWHLTGEPAESVRVVFIPEGGVYASPDTFSTYSDSLGAFTIRMNATGRGGVTGRLVFYPPEPYSGFVFATDAVHLAALQIRNEVQRLGLWGVGPLPVPPRISYVGELWYTDRQVRAEGVEVEFRRTGGLQVVPDTFVVTSDAYGRFPLFMAPAVPGEAGVVVGDLYVRPPAPHKPMVISGVRMETTTARDYIRLLGVWWIE